MRKVEFFYDVVSPYSYLAFETILSLKNQWKLDIQLKPFYLAGVMQASGNRPPASVAARGAYLAKDIQRQSKYFGVDIKFPSRFPINTITPMRILSVIKEEYPSKLENTSRLFWKGYWHDDIDISDERSINLILKNVGFDQNTINKLHEASKDQKYKDKLKAVTEEAVNRGAFGAPTIFIHTENSQEPEFFFGSDRFHLIANLLGENWQGPPRPKLLLCILVEINEMVKIFGVPLEHLPMERDPVKNLTVPKVLIALRHQLIVLDGHQETGIFRISADAEKLAATVNQLENSKVDSEVIGAIDNAHIVSGLIKKFFMSLPDKLLPNIENNAQSNDIAVILDEPNLSVYRFLISLLCDVSSEEKSKMSPFSLAVVFAPSLSDLVVQDCPNKIERVINYNKIVTQFIVDCMNDELSRRGIILSRETGSNLIHNKASIAATKLSNSLMNKETGNTSNLDKNNNANSATSSSNNSKLVKSLLIGGFSAFSFTVLLGNPLIYSIFSGFVCFIISYVVLSID